MRRKPNVSRMSLRTLRGAQINDRNRRGWHDCPRVYCKHPSPSLLCVLLQFYAPRWARAACIPTGKGKVACAHAAIDKTKISYVTVTSICTQQHSKMDGYSVVKIAYGTNATRMTLNKTVALWACSCAIESSSTQENNIHNVPVHVHAVYVCGTSWNWETTY